MPRTPVRRPQRPKVRNFVAKHAKDFAGRAGPHKDEKHDYERRPRNQRGGVGLFDPETGEPLEPEAMEKNWMVEKIVPGNCWNAMPALPEGMALHRVWTVMHPDLLEERGLIHNVTAFLEDNMHDYVIDGGNIRYFSRVVETGVPVEVAFEYESMEANLDRKSRRGLRR